MQERVIYRERQGSQVHNGMQVERGMSGQQLKDMGLLVSCLDGEGWANIFCGCCYGVVRAPQDTKASGCAIISTTCHD
jgi:hypothetical protein